MGKDVTCSGADDIVCTVAHCDGLGKCDDKLSPDDKACKDAHDCTLDKCDPAAPTGCTHTAVDTVCEDGNQCTDNLCDVLKGCNHPAKAGPCKKDDLACTNDVCVAGTCTAPIASDSCVIDGACVAQTVKSAKGCLACDPIKSQGKWTAVAPAAPCDSDGLACTIDACDGLGVCASTTEVDKCLIAGQCQAKDATSAGGCFKCVPGTSQKDWTPVAKDTACVGDMFSCTVDLCDGKGGCTVTPDSAKCADPLGCTEDSCDPKKAGVGSVTGCVNADNCPFGHQCFVKENACLSCDPKNQPCKAPEAVALVTGGGDTPNPTNPAVVRHVLDAAKGYSRTWVVYQTDTCAVAEGVGWKIKQPATLRAIVLDNSIDAVKPAPAVSLATYAFTPSSRAQRVKS